MNRRTLALGAAIVLPAGLAVFHAEAASPPASTPSRPRRDADRAIRGLHRAYFAAREDECRICAEPKHKGGSAENGRQEEALADAVGRQCDAVEAIGKKHAASLEAVAFKAAIFNDTVKGYLSGDFEIEPDNRMLLLAVSISADLARLMPSEGGQA